MDSFAVGQAVEDDDYAARGLLGIEDEGVDADFIEGFVGEFP